jgi:hypothetical protein
MRGLVLPVKVILKLKTENSKLFCGSWSGTSTYESRNYAPFFSYCFHFLPNPSICWVVLMNYESQDSTGFVCQGKHLQPTYLIEGPGPLKV